jgi:hypothetical protein
VILGSDRPHPPGVLEAQQITGQALELSGRFAGGYRR